METDEDRTAAVANFFFLLHNGQYRFLAARPALGEMEKPADVAFAALQGTCPCQALLSAHNNKRDSDNGASGD